MEWIGRTRIVRWGKGGSHALSGNKFGSSDNQPMVEVTWHGAKAFAVWLSGKTGKRLRLPTEAQWKYACRSGGKPEKYAGGGSVGRKEILKYWGQVYV